MPDFNEVQKYTWALASRGLPTPAVGDSVYIPARSSRYGELVTQALAGSKMYAAADEGSYFVATNPTPGTAIAGIATILGYGDRFHFTRAFTAARGIGPAAYRRQAV
jgi:AraC-like DNA-binding protein